MTQREPNPDRFPWKKAAFSAVLCLLFVAGGYASLQLLSGMKQQPPRREEPEKVYAIEAFVVEQADLEEIITAFGTTRANREVTLDAQVSGEIVDVRGPVDEARREQGLKVGQTVRGPEIRTTEAGASDRFLGDLLLRIDPSTYQERVAQAENLLNEDEAELKRLRQEQTNNDRVLKKVASDYAIYKRQYQRVEKLHKQGISTDSELADAELELARYEDATIQRENEKALYPRRIELLEKKKLTHQTDLELARLELARTNVRPPFSGVISEVMVEQGKFVNAGEPLLRLTDTTDVEIPLPLTLYDFAKIERKLLAGQTPRVELSEHETAPKRWVGYVVRRAPEADVNSRTVEVFVHVDNDGIENEDQPIALLPSVFVHARIDGPVIERALVVPRDAIRNGKLFVVTNLKQTRREAAKPGSLAANSISSAGESSHVSEGVIAERSVTIDRALRNVALVSAGLKPGDHVAMTNLDVIHTGAKVRIETRVDLGETLQQQGTPALRRHTLAGGPSKDDRGAVEVQN